MKRSGVFLDSLFLLPDGYMKCQTGLVLSAENHRTNIGLRCEDFGSIYVARAQKLSPKSRTRLAPMSVQRLCEIVAVVLCRG